METFRAVAMVLACLSLACSQRPLPYAEPDAAASFDFGADLAAPRDLSTLPDLGSPDLSRPDLAREPPSLEILAGAPGGAGNLDGIAGAARFEQLRALALDGAGHLWVGQQGSARGALRRIDLASRAVETVQLPDNGPNTGGVSSLAFDQKNGVLYFVYLSKLHAREAGVVRALKLDDADGEIQPERLRFDAASGLLYVIGFDGTHFGTRIWTRDEKGVVTRLGDGPARAVAPDGPGQLLFALFNAVARLDLATGQKTVVAGAPNQPGSGDGVGAAARFAAIGDMVPDSAGNLYIIDANRLRIIDRKSVAVTTLASLDDLSAPTLPASLVGLALDEAAGAIYFALADRNEIRRFDLATKKVEVTAGAAPSLGAEDGVGPAARFRAPRGLERDDDGNLYVADRDNHTIRKIARDGRVSTVAGVAGEAGSSDGARDVARLSSPRALAKSGGRLAVLETLSVGEFYAPLRIVDLASGGVSSTADLDFARDVVAAPGGGFFLSHRLGELQVKELDASGGFVRTVTLSPERIGGSLATLDGKIYLTIGFAIYEVDPANGTRTLLAGGAQGFADQFGASARFSAPFALASDGAGHLFLLDDRRVRRVDVKTGQVRTLLGDAAEKGVRLGALDQARLNEPADLVALDERTLAVSDAAENLVLRLHLPE